MIEAFRPPTKTWGSLLPNIGPTKGLTADVTRHNVALMQKLDLPFTPDVERYIIGHYYPDVFDPQDYLAEVTKFEEKFGNVLFPLSFFWVTMPYSAAYMAHMFYESIVTDILHWTEHAIPLLENALDATDEVISDRRIANNVTLYLIETLAPAIERTLNDYRKIAINGTGESNVVPWYIPKGNDE